MTQGTGISNWLTTLSATALELSVRLRHCTASSWCH